MELRHRVQRHQWGLRGVQALAAAATGALTFGLVAAAEGRSPWAFAILGGALLGLLVLAAGRPWQSPLQAIDPDGDTDGLLRTALSEGLRPEQAEGLLEAAQARPVRLCALPEWQAWGLAMGLATVAAGWVLVAPPEVEVVPAYGLSPGLTLDGRPAQEDPAPLRTGPAEAPAAEVEALAQEDGATSGDEEQWAPLETGGNPAVGLGLDLGLDQQVYERYLRYRSQRP